MGDMIRYKRIYNDVISAYIIRYINEKRREVKLLSILVPRPELHILYFIIFCYYINILLFR